MVNKLPFEKVERRIIVKKQAVTDPNLGGPVNARAISDLMECGIVNIDKPRGPTSHDVIDRVREILQIRKAGHSGTLDPAATGVLPVALGRATRILEVLLAAGKEYVCRMHIHEPVEQAALRQVFAQFTGPIEQVPPVRSVVKRVKRTREIYYMEILAVQDKDIVFRVGCQAGTYIRKLVHDMGVKMGVGAHMTELRRTKAGCFDESSLCSLQRLAEAHGCWREQGDEKALREVVQPIENAVRHLPKVWIDDFAVDPVCHGYDLFVPGIVKLHSDIEPGDTVAVMTLKDELIAIGQSRLTSEEMIQQEKGVAASVHKVFMREGTYSPPQTGG
jgi:H/ACA ribonucleoprotein complex subunit 4